MWRANGGWRAGRLPSYLTAVLAAAVAAIACQGTVIEPPHPGAQLTGLGVTPRGGAPADDVSLVTVTATVPDSGVIPSQVVFSATAGAFLPNDSTVTTVATVPGVAATAELRGPRQPGEVFITAAAGSARQDTSVQFSPAEPDTIVLEPSRFGVGQGDTNELVITAFLRRNTGLVSLGTAVTFADTCNGIPIAAFGAASLSGDSGIVRVRYSPLTGTGSVADTITAPVADTITASATAHDTTFARTRLIITVSP